MDENAIDIYVVVQYLVGNYFSKQANGISFEFRFAFEVRDPNDNERHLSL